MDSWLNEKAVPLDPETEKKLNASEDDALPHKVRTFCPVCKKHYNGLRGNWLMVGEDTYAVHLIKRAHNKCAEPWMPEADYYDANGVLIYSSGDFPSHYDEKGRLQESWHKNGGTQGNATEADIELAIERHNTVYNATK